MKLIVKTFQEITIKSRPVRKRFIRQLAKNIRAVLRDLDPELKVEGEWDNLEVETAVVDAKARREMIERLTCTPGIGHFLEVHEYPLGDFDDILAKCKAHFGDQLAGKTFAVRCKRAGKHAFTSMEVERYVGSGLRRECGAAGIDLKQPEVEVRMEIRLDRLFVIHRQHPGLGGYPLGALEQVLVLMSGGFDSTVAAYQMMRRGMISHFVFFNLGGRAHELGVMEVAHYLWEKYGRSQRVLFVSVPFEEVVGEILTKVDDSYMGVTLKRMMLRAASRVAERLELDALVTGEAISQVSSQTLPKPLGDRPGYRHPGAAPADRQPQAGHHRHRPADRHRRVRPAHAGILRGDLGEPDHPGQALPRRARRVEIRHGGARARPGARHPAHRRPGDRRTRPGPAGGRGRRGAARSDCHRYPPS
ncbi:tRNA s(4)U8 sulfurtransferase [Pseudomonas aeruginosa]|nr:tRNA s(4)U8 sulfurtransferase [Pseudomonas aeruginosa]